MEDPLKIDPSVLDLAKAGDGPALNKIMMAFQKAIFNHLYRLTGSSADAADLTQDTFFKLYKKRHLIDPRQNFKAWLYTMATHTAYDWFDKIKRHPEIAIPEDDESETIVPITPYYRIDTATSLDMEMALKKIKPAYQTIIFLYYQQGFSYEEIAEIIKIPLGTVKTWLFRAKQDLAKELKDYQ